MLEGQPSTIDTSYHYNSMTVFNFDNYNILFLTLVNLVLQSIFAVTCYLSHWNKIVDFSGGASFICLAILSLVLSQAFLIRQLIATVFVCVWAARLSTYLVYRMVKIGEYDRFEEKRKKIIYFVIFWIFQFAWIEMVILPVVCLNSPEASVSKVDDVVKVMTYWDIAGFVLFIIGLMLETFADAQKFVYLDDPKNRGKWCNYGLWSLSRHPNYFGEMMVWWGIFSIGMPLNYNARWTTILGPIFLTGILLFLSGLPIMEYKSDRKYGGNPHYIQYKTTTSPLFPIPSYIYRRLPIQVKRFLCLELPLYNSLRNTDKTNMPHRTSLDLMLQAIDDFP